MEPIASSGASAAFRPTGGGSAEAANLLREGRVLNAEVLGSNPDGTLQLALGRHSIPAETDLRLDPGTRFLVRVEAGPEGPILNLVPSGEGEETALLRALRATVGEGRGLGEVLGELERALRALPESSGHAEHLGALALGLGAALSLPEGGAGGLRAWLAFLGLGHESTLATLVRSGSGRPDAEPLRGDLKALLLRALGALDEDPSASGELREVVGRALRGLEAEQLLNLARERAGEPQVLSFPFPDGEGWATARLVLPPRRERAGGSEAPEESIVRVAFGLELTQLGPVRADLTLAPTALSVRLLVTEPDVLQRVEAQLARLGERLGDGRRRLELHVRLGTPAEAALGFRPLDIRYLREHHLMNVSG